MMVDLFWLILHDCDVLTNTKTLVLRHFVVYASQPGLITDRLDHMHTTLRRGFSNRRAAFSQQRAQFEDDREHLMVMIGTLPVMRFLLALHNPSVFLEVTLGEPHQQRPRGIKNARDLRPADGQQAECAVG